MRMIYSRKTAGLSGFYEHDEFGDKHFEMVLHHEDFKRIYEHLFEQEDVNIDFTETVESENEEQLKESLRGMEKESIAYATGRLPETVSYSQKVVDAVNKEMGLW